MPRYIDAEAFVVDKRKQYCENCQRRKGKKKGRYTTLYEIGQAPCKSCGINDVIDDVEEFPTADAQEVIHSRWIPLSAIIEQCANCATIRILLESRRYCPSCGAKMDLEDKQ